MNHYKSYRNMGGTKLKGTLAFLLTLMLIFSVWTWDMPAAKAEEPLLTEEPTPTPESTPEPTPEDTAEKPPIPTTAPTSEVTPVPTLTPEPSMDQLYKTNGEASIVTFSDANLKQALLDAGVDSGGDGDITEIEMAALTGTLDLSDKGIANLSGLEYAENLTGLDLDNNNGIKSIANLSPLSDLAMLSIVFTDVSDISVVTNFPNLSYLDISRSDVIDLSPLSGLNYLETLLLNVTDVNSIIPIQGMTSLKKLSLAITEVRDITALSNLTNLTYLDISSDYLAVDSISELESLTNLEFLNIAYNSFYDSTPLSGMHHLKELNASWCDLTSIDSLSEMYDLENLNLKYCNVTDISVLADKTNLNTIDVSDNYLNPNDTDGDMAVLAGIDTVIGANKQYKIKITYNGGLYGTPERSYDNIYHGDTITLPTLAFDGSFDVGGWDTDGDGIADVAEATEYCAEPPFIGNFYNATYDAIYQRNYTWPSGSGTEQDPYLVSTPQQVNEIRYLPEACFLLTNDIDMSAVTSEGGDFYYEGAGWNPIQEFKGTLDGDGYKISGLFSKRVRTSFIDTVAESAVVKNFVLYDIYMLGEDGVDGLCFENSGTILNCAVCGYIAQTIGDIGNSSFDAGIAGINYGTVSGCWVEGTVVAQSDSNMVGSVVAYNGGLIENSCNFADVWAMRISGGIAARNMATITGCYNMGAVFSDYYECGGIAGNNYFGAEISNCYNIGRIHQDTAGGIAGKSGGTVSNCYNIGSVQGKSIVCEVYGGTVSNCYTIESANEIIESNAGVSHVVSLTNDGLQQQSSFAGFDFGSVWTMAGNSEYPYPELQQVTMAVPTENKTGFAGGNGLPYNPYRIETAAQLNNVRYSASGWFELQNDIDLTLATQSGGAFYNDGAGWTPIGEDDYYFNGVFDGNGHSIIGLWMDNPDDGGLFASCGVASTIKDLGVARADIKCHDKAGIIAIMNAGDILRCYTSGKINSRWAGGLVSENYGLISNCYTTASVRGEYIGGLAGTSSGIIERCYNAGSVKGGYDFARTALLGDGCYHWKNDKAASGSAASDPGIELTEEQFLEEESFEYFNFNTVWTMAGDAEYPYPELAGLKHIEEPDNTVEFAGGNGLPYAPYLISSSTHLNNMRSYNSENFELLADIGLGGANWESFDFYGNFEGNNNVISDGNIIVSDWNEGFFKSTNYSTISNLGIDNINMVSEYNSPIGTFTQNTGLFAGKLNYSRITNCYATGSINCVRGEHSGGFAGCSNSRIVDCYANANIIGEDEVGGFIGYLTDYTSHNIPDEFSEVKNCHFTGEVEGKNSVGGFVGYTVGKVNISDCYLYGEVSGVKEVGGVVGLANGMGDITNCYVIVDVSGNLNIGAFIGNEGSEIIYENCYWYSNVDNAVVGIGREITIVKINIPEIDDVDIDAPVHQSALSTNFNLYGSPASLEFISTKDPRIAIIENEQLKGVSLGNTEVDLLFTYDDESTVQLNGYKTSITGIPPVIVPVTGITLDQSELYIHRNNILTLTATILPENATNKNLIWESDNDDVISVNSFGIITANQAGYATITVTTEDGGYSASCNISVDTPTSVVTQGNSYCWPGEFRVYTATVLPSTAANKSVIWSSSDESVATVGETTGIVHAIAPGTTTITVTTVVGGFTDTANIYVRQPVTGVEVIPETISINVGEQFKSLNAIVLPETAFNKGVSYSSDHSGVASVDLNGYITGVSPGIATITVTTQDGGLTDNCIVTVLPAAIQSSQYTIDRSAGFLKGVTDGTTVAQLKSRLDNDSDLIKVYDADDQEVTEGVVGTGMTIKYSIDGELRDSLSIVVPGDTSGDGAISISDYVLVRLDILGLKDLSGAYSAAGDVNGDGQRNVTDYTLIRLDILGEQNVNG